MRNRYASACALCGISVEPGEGFLERVSGTWLVTHADPCPRNDYSKRYSLGLAKKIGEVLESENSSERDVEKAAAWLARMVRAVWLTQERCEQKILGCRALEGYDRLEVEDLLIRYLRQPIAQRPS